MWHFRSRARAACGSLVVLCVVSVCPAKRLGLMQSRMKWDSCGCWGRRGHENTCGIDQRLQPNTTQWGGRGEKLCVNHLRQMSKSARGVSHFYPPERQFNLTRRVYGEGRDVFFRSAAWIRNPDLAFVTLSRCNFKDGPTIAQSQCRLLILIARFEKGKSRMNHVLPVWFLLRKIIRRLPELCFMYHRGLAR